MTFTIKAAAEDIKVKLCDSFKKSDTEKANEIFMPGNGIVKYQATR